MVINKKDLLYYLDLAMLGVEKTSHSLIGGDCFIFDNGKIYSYNNSIAVTIPIQNENLLQENLNGCVSSNEFYTIINKFPGEEIKFTKGKNCWILKCGKAVARITLMEFSYENRLRVITTNDKLWQDFNEEFLEAVKLCNFENKTKFTGLYAEKNKVVSTDGNQMHLFNLKNSIFPKVLFPNKTIEEVLKIKKIKQIQFSDNWVHFKNEEGVILSLKVLDLTNYISSNSIESLEKSNNLENAVIHNFFPKELLNAVDRAFGFSETINEHPTIKLVISKENVVVITQRNSGSYKEIVSWETEIKEDFEKIELFLDVNILLNILNKTMEFYLIKNNLKNDKQVYRLVFCTSSSEHFFNSIVKTE